MPLSWNEIKTRALAFALEWHNETSEDAEAKSFWDGFFNIFGISRKRMASFEEPVKKLGDGLVFPIVDPYLTQKLLHCIVQIEIRRNY